MTSYRAAGVDLAAADRHIDRIAGSVTATWNESVVGGFGGFAAGVTLPPGFTNPVLMMTTDGVGTKLELARRTSRWEGVGYDLVAMVVDDLAAAGARPLGLVDYLAVGALHPDRDAVIVESIARACVQASCPLLGGETAEHPGVMAPDQVDLAASALGVVERGQELGAHRVRAGDVVIGLTSPNLRSNGFSLVRAIVEERDLDEVVDGTALADQLLEPSLIYASAVLEVMTGEAVHAAAHITGGGLEANLTRVIPPHLRATIDWSAWTPSSIFSRLAEWGQVPEREMRRTFNMGIGFCLVVDHQAVVELVATLGHEVAVIGSVGAG